LIQCLAASLGLVAWNLPGYLSVGGVALSAPNFINYFVFSMAEGLLEGFAQLFVGQFEKGIQEAFLNICDPKFIKKLAIGFSAGAIWSVSFIAQGIGSFALGAPGALVKFSIAATSLALSVGYLNIVTSMMHEMVDKNLSVLKISD